MTTDELIQDEQEAEFEERNEELHELEEERQEDAEILGEVDTQNSDEILRGKREADDEEGGAIKDEEEE